VDDDFDEAFLSTEQKQKKRTDLNLIKNIMSKVKKAH